MHSDFRRFPGHPPPYGRIIRDPNQEIVAVIEEKDASQEQLKIREVNSSIYLFENETVFPLLPKIKNDNIKNEYYLTDIIALLKNMNLRVGAMTACNHLDTIGVNTRWELQQAQKTLNERHLKFLALEGGITILQPQSVTIELGVEIGRDTIIYPSTYIAAGTRIGKNCHIGPFVYLKGVMVPDHSTLIMKKQIGGM